LDSILLVFIDGLGIGKNNPDCNPFVKYGFNTFTTHFNSIPTLDNQYLAGNKKFLFPVDANLGILGLPQSGTGQASLFCGYNAAQQAGMHYGPFPHTSTLKMVNEKHLLNYYSNNRGGSYFANAYPKPFFDYLKSGKTRLGVTATHIKLNGKKFNTISDVRKGKALTAEIINNRWNEKLNYTLPLIQAQTAARRLLRISAKYKFTQYEFYLLDHLGHLRIKNEFKQIFNCLDLFLFTILSEFNEKKLTIVICSDHGNFEDLSQKMHTRNPALTITAGKYAEELFTSIKSLPDIKPQIIKYCR
jgi:phosphopentomutase